MLALYLGVAYITLATQGIYVYKFLNPHVAGQSHGTVAGYCFAVLGACIVLFFISWGLIWLRRRLTGGKRKRDGSQGFWSPRPDMEMGTVRGK